MQNEKNDDYPSEFQSFLDKQWLFKVEVGDGNIINNWHCFSVKRTTDDSAVIQQFIAMHNRKVHMPNSFHLLYFRSLTLAEI